MLTKPILAALAGAGATLAATSAFPKAAQTAETVASPNLSTAAMEEESSQSIYVSSDSLQSAVDRATANGGGIIRLPAGDAIIPATITHGHNVRFVGAGKNVTTVVNLSNTDYAFRLLPPRDSGDAEVSLGWEDLTILAKYGIKVGDETDFAAQTHLKGMNVTRVRFTYPDYQSGKVDPKRDTTAIPTFKELEEYGVGFYGVKCFDAVFTSVEAQMYGIGIVLDGCDVTTIRDSRFGNNGRHIHVYGHDTYGGRVGIDGNDFVRHHRMGGIYTDAHATRITNNYLESRDLIGQSIRGGSGGSARGLLISGNSFDLTNYSHPSISVDNASYGMIISDNHAFVKDTSKVATVEVRPGWDVVRKAPIQWGVNPGFARPATVSPAEQNPYLLAPGNVSSSGGVALSSWPYITSPATGRTVFRTNVSSILARFPLKSPGHRTFKVIYVGRSVGAGGYRVARYIEGSTTTVIATGSRRGFTKTDEVEAKTETLTIPAGAVGTGRIEIELVNTEVEYESVEIQPI